MINSNLSKMQPSPTMIINELVKNMKNEGKDIISLGFGQSPFPPPEKLVKQLQKYAEKHEYLPVQGHLPLRQEIADYYSNRDSRIITADDVIIGPGTKELQFLLQLAMQKPTIFILSPCWVSYQTHCKILNNKINYLDTTSNHNWKLQENHVDIINKTSGLNVLIFTTPNNPTGTVYTEKELKYISDNLDKKQQKQTLLLLDEIYSELSYQDDYTSLAKYCPTQSIISSGISKWLGSGGWRLGYLIFPPELSELKKIVISLASETYSCATTPIQYACCGIFNDPIYKDYCLRERKILKALSDYCYEILNSSKIVTTKSLGAWYLFLEFKQLDNILKVNNILNCETLATKILTEIQVATTPATHFLNDNNTIALRLCLVDFDGQQALNNCTLDTIINEQWLINNCGRVIKGVRKLRDWICRF